MVSVFRNAASTSQTGSQIQITQNNVDDWAFGQPAGVSAFAIWSGRNANTTGVERLRITSGGDLCVGDTAAGNQNSNSLSFDKANGRGYVNHVNGTASGTIYWNFALNGTGIGSITQNGTTAVAYNTSSDYRLKTNLEPIPNGINRLKQLPVYRFNWIADETGNKVDGFVAHEVKQIVPEAITGEKDAVDADGKPVYQGIDQSKIVPLLTAALKEAIAKIETLESKVTALEAPMKAVVAAPLK